MSTREGVLKVLMAFKTLSGVNETSQRGSRFTLASEQTGSMPLPTLAKCLLSRYAFCKSLKYNFPVGVFNVPMLDLRFKRLLT